MGPLTLQLGADHVQRLLNVQGPLFALVVDPVEVPQAVGHVAGLLNLIQQNASADGMHHARRHVEHVARLDRHPLDQRLHVLAASQGPAQVVDGHALPDAVQKGRVLLGMKDHPCFGLAQLVLVRFGVFVVRVNLYAQGALGRQQLQQQGKFRAFRQTRQPGAVALDQRRQGHAAVVGAFQTGNHAHFQRFAGAFIGNFLAEYRLQLFAAPGGHVAVAVGRMHPHGGKKTRLAHVTAPPYTYCTARSTCPFSPSIPDGCPFPQCRPASAPRWRWPPGWWSAGGRW